MDTAVHNMEPTRPIAARPTRAADSPLSAGRSAHEAAVEPSSSTCGAADPVAGPEGGEGADRPNSPWRHVRVADPQKNDRGDHSDEHNSAAGVEPEDAEVEEELDPWGRPYIINRTMQIDTEDHPHYPRYDKSYQFARTTGLDKSVGDDLSVPSPSVRSKNSQPEPTQEEVMLVDRTYATWSHLWAHGKDTEGLEMLQHVLEEYERFHGVCSIQVAEVCMRIGDVLNRQSSSVPETSIEEADDSAMQHTDAKSIYRRSIETYKNCLGDQHSHLEDSYIAVGPYPELSIHHGSSLHVTAKASQERNSRPTVAMPEADLVPHLTARGYAPGVVAEAVQFAKDEALREGGHFDGPDPYATMTVKELKLEIMKWRLTLVNKLITEGDLDTALDVQLGILTNYELNLGSSHPSTAEALVKLGEIRYQQGDHDHADEDWERALNIYRKMSAGEMQAPAAMIFGNLGAAALKLRRYDEAERLHARALRIRRQVLGSYHARVGDSYFNLGNVALKLGDFEKAKAYFGRALDIKRGDARRIEMNATAAAATAAVAAAAETGGLKEGPSDPSQIGKAMSDVMDDVIASELEFQAEKDAGRGAKGSSGQHHQNVRAGLAQVYHQLGAVAGARGNFEDALDLFQRALDLSLAEFGESSDDVARCYTSLGSVHQAQGDYDGAKALLTKALTIDRTMHGEGSIQVAKSLYNLGVSLAHQGRRKEAWKSFDESVRILVKLEGEEHPHTKKVRGALAEVHESLFGVDRESTIGGTVGRRGRIERTELG